MSWVELVGYLASALIVASLAMRSVVRLRLVSLVGSLVFVAYGLLITAWPIVISNIIIAGINVWYLAQEFSAGKHPVSAIEADQASPFLQDFLAANAAEIRRTQPDWQPSEQDTFVRILMRDGLPAGVLLGEPVGRELTVHLDYVTPAYRDSRVASWLFGDGRSVFTSQGLQRLVAAATTSEHRGYLEMVGFRPEGGLHVLDLDRG